MSAPAESSAATTRPELDRQLERLRQQAAAFARMPIGERIALLERIRDGYLQGLDAAIAEGCRVKGLDPDSEAAGEEWFAHGFCVVRHIRLLLESLGQIAREGAPHLEPSWIRRRPNGALAVRSYPLSRLDALAFPGIRGEIYLQKGIDEQTLRAQQAAFYKSPHGGRVSLVLGAGNVASIPPRDTLNKMFNEGKVVLLKMNPVNQYLGPFLEQAFRPAIEQGFFAIAYGGAEEGSYLAHHPLIDEVHITGSDKTHDAIVWGPPGPERDERRRRGTPLLQKEITSELGNISPVVVLPGPWSESDLEFQARSIAGMVANNASFNCNSAKLLIDARRWSGREALLNRLEQVLAAVPPRNAYYPGAAERYQRFTSGRPQLEQLGLAKAGQLPWAIVPGIDPHDADEPFFHAEPWCSVLAETTLSASDPVAFLEEAVRFLNDRVWGTLCATLLVHPSLMKDKRVADALERATEDLQYGTVAFNVWPAAAFSMGTTAWGGHPSSTLADIQSGRGWIGNTLMLEGIEKSVLRAPFRMTPKPVWFPDHRTLGTLGRKVVELERNGSWLKLPAVAMTALRG